MAEVTEKIRNQFNKSPYPDIPIERSVKELTHLLFIYSITTAYYFRYQKVYTSQKRKILDVGCGSGVTTLLIAEANPEAEIVGIDLSEVSIEFARKRLAHYGFNNATFYVMPLEELSTINIAFDYINCDETLYLLPDPLTGLRSMKSVLAEKGIIRTNLHSLYQRIEYFRAQKLAKLLGLMEEDPSEREYNIMKDIMGAIRDNVILKSTTWNANNPSNEFMQANYFLQGDRGFTIPEMFALLDEVELDFVGMVDWRGWDMYSLLKDRFQLPEFLKNFLDKSSIREWLTFYELLQPTHRLLDFWCGHKGASIDRVHCWQQDSRFWYSCRVHLHPALKTETLRKAVQEGLRYLKPFRIFDHDLSTQLDPASTSLCLHLLWEKPCYFAELITAWQQIKPTLDSYQRASVCFNPQPVLQPVATITEAEAYQDLLRTLVNLEWFKFIMIEPAERSE